MRRLLLVPLLLLVACGSVDHRTAAEVVAKDLESRLTDPPAAPTGSTIDTWPAAPVSTPVDPTGFRAARPGKLPAKGAEVGGVHLPSGHVVGGVLWASDNPVNDVASTWSKLRKAFPETGLWPLILDQEGVPGWEEQEGRLDPNLAGSPDGIDAAAVLADWWRGEVPTGEDAGQLGFYSQSPYGEAFPGLTPAPEGRPDEQVVDRLAQDLKGKLGLVAVTRPADVAAVIGWSGMVNYDHDPADLAAVIRSWEDRFGAVVVGLGLDTMTLVARRPPRTKAELVGVAAEHFAVAPDNVLQGAETIGGLADLMRSEPAGWSLWWD